MLSGLDSFTIPLFPLGAGLFPDGLLVLQIFEIRYLEMVKKALRDKSLFGVVALCEGSEVQQPGSQTAFESIGTLAEIVISNAVQPALYFIRCRGRERFQIHESSQGRYGLWSARVELQRKGLPEAQMPIWPPYRLDECGWVAYRWAELLPLSPEQKRGLLEENDPELRLRMLAEWMGPILGEDPPARAQTP
ncbi:MAG: peptidase S16 [Betaproteobacteria bacterium]|nr:peptidase S16 [Betaproteobacteria bacterium]